jgi:hypothetical protein
MQAAASAASGRKVTAFQYNERVSSRALAFFWIGALFADVRGCACNPQRPETMEARECGLCREADKAPAGEPVFFLKDINPRKPNRWLALPRAHYDGGHGPELMSRADRTALWKAAIAKAKELWGEEWGLAYNGELVRTQCHGHIHIGKLLKGVEYGTPLVVSRPEDIPAPPGKGVWVHPAGTKLHVHIENTITETVLLR